MIYYKLLHAFSNIQKTEEATPGIEFPTNKARKRHPRIVVKASIEHISFIYSKMALSLISASDQDQKEQFFYIGYLCLCLEIAVNCDKLALRVQSQPDKLALKDHHKASQFYI